MAATLFHMDAANLFCGVDNPESSEFLAIKNIKLPPLEEKTKDHEPGGGVMSIQLGMRCIMAPTLGFDLEGIRPHLMNKFMPVGGREKYTVRGNMRDIKAQTDLSIVAILEGRMTKADIGDFSRSEGVSTQYEITECTQYKLYIDGAEKYFFDFFQGPIGARTDGNPIFQGLASNLGLF